MAPDYDHLLLMQKVEVFEYALETTTGDDLAKILWYKSPSSEVRSLSSSIEKFKNKSCISKCQCISNLFCSHLLAP